MVSVSPLVAATLFMVQVTSSVAFISPVPRPRCSRCSTSGGRASSLSLGKPVLLSSSRAARSRIRRLLSSLDNAGDRRQVVGCSRQFQLQASSSSNDNGVQPDEPKAKKATTTTTDLKELASRIDKNNSSPSPSSSREGYTGEQIPKRKPSSRPRYQLGVGKNSPLLSGFLEGGDDGIGAQQHQQRSDESEAANNWVVREVVNNLVVPGEALKKKPKKQQTYDMGLGKNSPLNNVNQSSDDEDDEGSNKGDVDHDEDDLRRSMRTTTRLLPNADELSARLTKAVWDEKHFDDSEDGSSSSNIVAQQPTLNMSGSGSTISLSNVDSTASVDDNSPSTQQPRQQSPEEETITDYQQIDLSVPPSVYSLGATTTTTNTPIPSQQPPIDLVWDLMRREAQTEAAREPLLVSFLYSTILNHATLESALSFHLANRLSSPAMLSTQIMSLIREALDADPSFRRNLRSDMLAVRDRDPACNCLPDVFLYFKGFHALQTYRVAHYLWRSGRRVLAHYLQSQVSQHFQIDIRELLLFFTAASLSLIFKSE